MYLKENEITYLIKKTFSSSVNYMFSQTVIHTNKTIGAIVILHQKLKQEN